MYKSMMRTTVQQTETMEQWNGDRSKAKRNFGKSNHRQKELGTRSYVLPDISQDTSPWIVPTGTRIP